MVNRQRNKRKHNCVSNTRKENSIKRKKGQPYLGFSTTEGVYKQNSKRPQRKMGLACSSNFCIKSKLRHCQKFDQETRSNIFRMFWNMSWEAKQVFVKSYVTEKGKTNSTVACSKKQKSFIFTLPKNQKSLQVCRFTFLSTLSVNADMVKGWLKPKQPSVTPYKTTISENKVHLKEYFDQLEKMESHYCRKNTNKLYIGAAFRTKADVYKDYCNYCSQNEVQAVSIFTFYKMFEKENLALYMPRKDQCDICVGFKCNQITVGDFDVHILNKNRAQHEKNLDKLEAEEGKRHVFTMDAQAVKLCPNINASAIYFKQRLQVHNFTVYNLGTHQCTNYWWSEVNGDLSASVFISCIINHLETFCLSDSLPITIFSDGCGYQNRNHYLSNALSNFAIKHQKVIEQKFLEKGHTQMECDSAHAKIEIRLKNQSIYLPHDYIRVTKEARQTIKVNLEVIRKPFDALYLNYDFFKNYKDDEILRFSTIRPGRVKNDHTVSDLRSLLYLPNGSVKYKVNFDENHIDLPTRIKSYSCHIEPKPLFSEPLAIPPNKWKNLQDLKPVIPQEYHFFYDNLKMDSKMNPKK